MQKQWIVSNPEVMMRKPVIMHNKTWFFSLFALGALMLAVSACGGVPATKPTAALPTPAPASATAPVLTATAGPPTATAPAPTVTAVSKLVSTPSPSRPVQSPSPSGAVTLDITQIQYGLYCPSKNEEARQAYNAGTDAQKRSKLADAQKFYQKAIDLDPQYCDAMDNLGIIYRQQGNLEQAIFWYGKSIAVNPSNPVPHTNLAVVYHRQGKLAEAAAEYQAVLKIDPNDPEGYFGLGGVYLSDWKYQEAVAQFNKAEELYLKKSSPYVKDARYGLALAYYSMKEWVKAREYFEQIYADRKDDANVNYYLGLCYLNQDPKNLEMARKYINRAKELGAKIPDEVLLQIK